METKNYPLVFGHRFFLFTAISAFIASAGIVIAQFILTDYPRPSGVDEIISMYAHPVYIGQSWTILLQVFFMFLALWGITVKMYKVRPALIATGFLFFIFWQIFELIPRSVDLFGISYTLAPQYLEASQNLKDSVLNQIRTLSRFSDSIAEVRRVMWALGHLAFGLAFWKQGKLEKWMSIFFLGNAARLVAGMVGSTVGPSFLASGGSTLFVIFMLPLFLLVGYWLLRNAKLNLPEQQNSIFNKKR